MGSHGHLYRLTMAFLISIGLNSILLAVDFLIDPRRAEVSRVQRWAVRLLSPAEALTMKFAPGHVGGVQIRLLSCSPFLSLPSWLGSSSACLRGGSAEPSSRLRVPPALPGIVSRRQEIVVLYERWRKALRSRLVGGGFKQP